MRNSDYLNSVNPNQEKPVLRMYGITENGNSVMVHIHSFLPYLYVELSPSFTTFDDRDLTDLKAVINKAY